MGMTVNSSVDAKSFLPSYRFDGVNDYAGNIGAFSRPLAISVPSYNDSAGTFASGLTGLRAANDAVPSEAYKLSILNRQHVRLGYSIVAIGLVAMAIGVGVSLAFGVSKFGILFPIGASILFLGNHIADRKS
jgi:hypothetical protein